MAKSPKNERSGSLEKDELRFPCILHIPRMSHESKSFPEKLKSDHHGPSNNKPQQRENDLWNTITNCKCKGSTDAHIVSSFTKEHKIIDFINI